MKTFTEKMMVFIAENELFMDIQWDENLHFFVICSDMFVSGADCEDITEEDFFMLQELLDTYTPPPGWVRQFCVKKRGL